MLDHLREDGGVVALEAGVGVGQGALDELDPGGLTLRHPVQAQFAGGSRQGPGRDVHPEHLGDPGVLEQGADQLALSAAEIGHAGRAHLAQGGQDRLAALLGQRRGLGLGLLPRLQLRLRLRLRLLRIVRVVDRVVDLLGLAVVGLRQPGELQPLDGRTGERPAAGQVTAGDQGLLRVVREPALACGEQLVHFVGRHPVVLGAVEHRQQDVQLLECVGQAQRPEELDPDVA